MTLELIGKFIGNNEIVSADVSDDKTPMGKDIVEVTFKSGNKRIFSALTLDAIVTDKATDENYVREHKFTPFTRAFMEMVAEYDLTVGEVEPLMQNIAKNIDNTFNRATNYLWTKDDKNFIAGFDPMYESSLLMAHKIIKGIANDSAD